jgi:DNA-binding GntR family transcriptional regulator
MKTVLKKSTLGQQTADILRDRIILGEYPQGQRLAEEELAEEFDISRASIREALRLLESEGMLFREINKRTYVRTFTKKEIKALFSIRALLERQSVKFCLANQCIPQKELRTYLEQMKRSMQIGPGAWNDYLRADIGFHLSIIKAMDNPYITEFWQLLQSQYLMVVYTLRVYKPDAFFGPSEAHEKILEQLIAGNGEPWFAHLDMVERDVDGILQLVK